MLHSSKSPPSEYRQSYVTAWLPLRARCTSFCLSGSASKEIAVKTFSVTEEIMEEEQYKYCISSATPQVFLQGLAADFSLASVTSCRSICKPNIFVSFSFRSVNCIEHIFVASLVWQYFTQEKQWCFCLSYIAAKKSWSTNQYEICVIDEKAPWKHPRLQWSVTWLLSCFMPKKIWEHCSLSGTMNGASWLLRAFNDTVVCED